MAADIKSTLLRLSSRQRQIVEQTVRDRLSTNATIELRQFADCHPTTVSRVTAQLCSLGWLSSYPLTYPTRYFRLGKRGASAFGLTVRFTEPLGPQALPTEYAVLRYAVTNHPHVRRLLAGELQALHPWYQSTWLCSPHCLRRGQGRSITELIRIDLGGTADHIARKCKSEISSRLTTDEFRKLLASREFQLVVITGSTEKSAQINAALKAHVWPDGMLFRIAVVTSLLSLLPRSF